ncbi:hypothetical protein Ccrd_018874 [Cynara cardunculus var. scolymus]|uniref:Uncharacterized protein n=1 Tax=Cynara cardunculus var. scolymus TaxID=59895 RepID=A0A103Y5E9_CYNCS|nr:hypothetical protein Ccrd_018874 [Cynara cardunculus var. scolymus]
MITRSKLVEQLRDSQIRSQHKWSPLVIFSPKPNLSTWAMMELDATVSSLSRSDAWSIKWNLEFSLVELLFIGFQITFTKVTVSKTSEGEGDANSAENRRVDVAVAILWATLFIVLVTSSYMTLYFRHFWLSFAIICLGILIPIRLRISRQTIARKKDRRLLLPLSM